MIALPLLLLGTILLSGTKSIAQNSSIIAQQTPAEKEAIDRYIDPTMPITIQICREIAQQTPSGPFPLTTLEVLKLRKVYKRCSDLIMNITTENCRAKPSTPEFDPLYITKFVGVREMRETYRKCSLVD